MALREYEVRPGLYYYINDHLGTPQRLITGEGTVVWQAAYLPFGRTQVQLGTVQNNLRFPGQYFDAETGLHYNWNRYYDPDTGRYLSPDPIGLYGGMNLYAYTNQNPINYIDHKGLFDIEDIKNFARDGRVRAISSFGVSLLVQAVACNIEPSKIRAALFALNSGLNFYSSVEAAVVSGGSLATAVADPDVTGITKVGLLGISYFFYQMADESFEDALYYMDAAKNDFNGEAEECIKPCKKLEKTLNLLSKWMK